jgi:hypothetical protein
MKLNTAFGDNIMKQAPMSNYNNFKGLPIFSELVKDLMA